MSAHLMDKLTRRSHCVGVLGEYPPETFLEVSASHSLMKS